MSWRLPPSSESSGDEGPFAPPCCRPAARPGRPAGVHPWRSLRDDFLRNHGIQIDRPTLPRPPGVHTAASDLLTSRMRIIEKMQALPLTIGILTRACALTWDGKPQKVVQQMADDLLGEQSRILMGQAAAAKHLDMDPRTCREHTWHLASAVHWGTRGWAGAILIMLRQRLQQGIWEAIAAITYFACDETPLPLRAKSTIDTPGRVMQSLADDVAGSTMTTTTSPIAQLEAAPDALKRNEKGLCKIVQSEAHIAFVVRVKSSKRYLLWHVPLSCPLAVVDRGTGECLQGNAVRQMDVPGLTALLPMFPLVLPCTTSDKASANIRMDESLQCHDWLSRRLRLPCFAHVTSTTQGHAFSPLQSVIAGAVATCAAQQPLGSANKLRQELALILWRDVVVVDAPRPPDDTPHRQQLRHLLSLCISKSQEGERRRMIIWHCLTGDPDSTTILWHAHGSVDKWEWAKRLASALYPAPIRTLPQHRWVNSLEAFQAYNLLWVHRLMEKVGPRWLALLAGKAVPRISEAGPVESPSGSAWRLPDTDEEPGESSDDGAPPEVSASDVKAPAQQHAEKNREDRRAAKCFIRRKPKHELLIGLVTMQLSVSFLHNIEHVADEAWDRARWDEFQKKGHCTSRMMEAHSGRLHQSVREDARALLRDSGRWGALPPSGHTRYSYVSALPQPPPPPAFSK